MHWARNLDVAIFHWVNPRLANPLLDVVMPFFSGNPLFVPVIVLVCFLLIYRGGARGRVCVFMILLAISLGDPFVCNTIKGLVERPRPFLTLPDVHVPSGIGRTNSGSMPSSHSANWFAATMVAFIYYRRSLRFMLPLALLVSFSRIYNGVHYPGDVLAGALLGSGYAALGVWTLDGLWRWAGPRWFPLWWQRLPSLLHPVVTPKPSEAADPRLSDRQWMRLAYALIFVLLAVNLAYIASGKITLSEDESYQWIWSKHPALAYYSKPPLIAYTQMLGTRLWGDTVFGVRFFAPVLAAITGIILLRFMARVVNVRVAFWLALIMPTVPLLAAGSILMTVDPLSVLFWTLTMLAGWRAVRDDSTNLDWLWVGLWLGLGFLSKATSLFQLLSWAVFFALWPPARKQLRRPGPYLALLINFIFALPVLIWNVQHDWITLHHLSQGGNFDHKWAFTPANLWYGFSRYTLDFVGVEIALLNPFFVLPSLWAALLVFKHRSRHPLAFYFLCMSAPLTLTYFLLTFHARVLPNWIAPSILPLFCLAVIYWEERWRTGARAIRFWLCPGLIIGAFVVVLMHDGNLVPKLTGYHPPPNREILRRVQGWAETAQVVEAAREKLLAEGKPVFIIGGHYGITSEVTFNLPEAKAGVPDHPLVYFLSADQPQNQFYFWPGYENRKGQNAIYVQELGLLDGDPEAPPPQLLKEFSSVTDLGPVRVMYHGKFIRRIQIMECRDLR